MSEQTKQVDTKIGISVVLNGGKKEMNSATIPIEWWFSKEIIEKDPKYIVFFEQDEDGKKNKYNSNEHGRRYACEVLDAFKYLQLFSPGYHRIMVIVVTGETDEKALGVVKQLLKRKDLYRYDVSLDWKKAEHNNPPSDDAGLIASTVEEFEVPQGLFAHRPETKLGKAIWKWANLWFNYDPRDECDYRKRRIMAFTLQPPLMAFWYFIKYAIGGSIYSLYVFLASIVILFVGYRPRPILNEMWKAFTFKRYAELDVRRYCYDDLPCGESLYRLWSIKKIRCEGGFKEVEKYMPITPWQVTLIVGAIMGIHYFKMWIIFGVLSATVAFIVLVAHIFSRYLDRTTPGRREKRRLKATEKRKRQEIDRELIRKWMLRNFDLSKKTGEVYLDRIPTPPDLQSKVIQKFRINYWTLKAKVCKPFSK